MNLKPANYYSPRTLIHELLEALSFVRFRYVDVPLGIGRNIVRAIELTCPVSTASELADNLQRFTAKNPNDLICSIRNNQKLLCPVGRECDIPYRSASKRLFGDERLSHERSVLLKNLNAIVRPIANIDKSIVRDSHSMHDAELRWWRPGRIILAGPVLMLHCTIEGARQALSGVFEIRIIGFASICTPMTLVGSRLHVEYDDSMVQVSVRHVELVFFLINDETRRTADILEIIASAVFSAAADLHEEFSNACEFQNLVILRPGTGEPDVVLRININTVLQLRPLISLSRTAP